MKKIIFLLALTFFINSCEKDDICTDETTPRLIIEFYDITNPSVLKNVTSLKVTGVGQTDALDTFSGVSKIELPLKLDSDITQYSFVLNSSSSSLLNEDFLEFNYVRNTVYVSRACGYKTVFELDNPSGISLTDATTPDGLWMQNIVINTHSITTENETHVKVFF
ncbi:MAG: DUF6452 family protein [Flavobacteriaceae bacterium]